jgi:hypothetical protein
MGEMGRMTINGPGQMKAAAGACLDAMKTNPAEIQSLFREKHVRYAARSIVA